MGKPGLLGGARTWSEVSPLWRRLLFGTVTLAGLAAIVALVGIPVRMAFEARDDLERLDRAAVEGFVRQLALPADIGTAPRDLFTVRRVPEVLVEPVRLRRAVAATAGLGDGYLEPACLTVRIDGQVVHRSGTSEPLIPASVQKILTAIGVIDTLDVDERFTTEVLTMAPVMNGEIAGDLVLVGGGDPMLGIAAYADAYRRQPQLRTSMEQLADSIASTGVRRVRGRVLVNDDRYDVVRIVESWPQQYVAEFNAGPIGALTVNDGFAEWDPRRVYANDPAIYAGQVLTSELARLGVRVDGSPRRGDVASQAEVLASLDSPTIGEIVQQMLRESDNNTAESLLKELGYRANGLGTTQSGAAVVLEAAKARGFDVTGLVVSDGSGLDRGNRVTCDVLAAILEAEGPASTIGSGLAVAGESGTIAQRFIDTAADGKLRAKTGLLNNVNGLAGWVEGIDGTVVTFAQLFNGIPLNSRVGFESQEALALSLASININITPADVAAVPSLGE